MGTVPVIRRLRLAFGLVTGLLGLTGAGILLGAVLPDRGASRLPLTVAGAVALAVSVAVSAAIAARAVRGVSEALEGGIDTLTARAEALRKAYEERERLDSLARSVDVDIRGCPDAPTLLEKAAEGLGNGLDASYAVIRLSEDGGEIAPVVERWQAKDAPVRPPGGPDLPPVRSQKLRELYDSGVSWYVDDIGRYGGTSPDPSVAAVSADLRDLPDRHLAALADLHAVAVLSTPFGAGLDLLGAITLIRTRPGQVWHSGEIRIAESVADTLGRALHVTRLKEAEQRVMAELRSLDRSKSEFLSTVSHELRTPLTSISGYLELLLDEDEGQLSERQSTMLETVDRNAGRLRSLIEDMLTLSRIESGTFTTSAVGPVDLAQLVGAAVGVMKPAADSASVALESDCPAEAVLVNGDARQLDRAVMNLLSNAVKFNRAGGRVDVRVGTEHDQAVLSVSDDGIGIPLDEQKSICTRFFRASNATELAIPGAGLGLSIVRTILANHSGGLEIRSEEGKGTTMTVRLPRQSPTVG